jgi:hypothetical protein
MILWLSVDDGIRAVPSSHFCGIAPASILNLRKIMFK